MKTIPTFIDSDDNLLTGLAAVEAWANQSPRCNCGSIGEAEHEISGSCGEADMPAKWLGCPNCRGQALGRPIVYRLPRQMKLGR